MIFKILLGLFIGFIYGLANHGNSDSGHGAIFPLFFILGSFVYGFEYGILGIIEIGVGYLLAIPLKR
jgi:hypothetical protein